MINHNLRDADSLRVGNGWKGLRMRVDTVVDAAVPRLVRLVALLPSQPSPQPQTPPDCVLVSLSVQYSRAKIMRARAHIRPAESMYLTGYVGVGVGRFRLVWSHARGGGFISMQQLHVHVRLLPAFMFLLRLTTRQGEL